MDVEKNVSFIFKLAGTIIVLTMLGGVLLIVGLVKGCNHVQDKGLRAIGEEIMNGSTNTPTEVE